MWCVQCVAWWFWPCYACRISISGYSMSHIEFQVLFCICTHQYLEFCGKLFWILLYTCNVVCSMYCMMVLAILCLPNEWYQAKIGVFHCCVSIMPNTRKFDFNSFESWYMHIWLFSDSRNSNSNGWNMCYGLIDHIHHWLAQIKL